MNAATEQPVMDFVRYPLLGPEDWDYAFATAMVRTMETQMLTRSILLDMANASSFEDTMELLNGSEYAMTQTVEAFDRVEAMLLEKRADARGLFKRIIENDAMVELFQSRDDFSNMRLAVRRVVTEKPIGLDYSNAGSVLAEDFEDVFEQENYSTFPEHMQLAVEAAVLGYYADKDIRRIDYEIDLIQADYQLNVAARLKSVFLDSLFRTQIDLTNIRTMLRLKVAEKDSRDAEGLMLPGGYTDLDKLKHGLEVGYEALAPLFYSTPYHDVVEGGVAYLNAEKSFLRLERLCEEHLDEFLKSTRSITAGPQPIIAHLLLKETEIRTVRMILNAKKNQLDTRLILDRLGES